MRPLPLLALPALVLPALAQSVLVVDDGGGPGVDHLQIQDAVAAADEGDTILVRSGTYAPVAITGKSLRIVEDAGAHVEILPDILAPDAPLLGVEGLLASQSVTVRGIVLRPGLLSVEPYLVRLRDNLGTVWIEDCAVVATPFFLPARQAGLLAEDCFGVTLVRCSIEATRAGGSAVPGDPPGIHGVRSRLSLFDTLAVGALGTNSTGFPAPQDGGPGVLLEGGVLFAAGCTLRGGFGGNAFLGQDGGDGGDGLVLASGDPTARLLDTLLQGGAGGAPNGPGTVSGAPGDPSSVASGTLTLLPGSARSFATASPVRAGNEPLTETFHGEPGDVVVLAFSLSGPLPGTFVPLGKADLCIAPPFVTAVKGVIDGTGTLVTQPPTTPLAAGLESLPLAFQGAMLSPSGVFLTSPSHLVFLGAGL